LRRSSATFTSRILFSQTAGTAGAANLGEGALHRKDIHIPGFHKEHRCALRTWHILYAGISARFGIEFGIAVDPSPESHQSSKILFVFGSSCEEKMVMNFSS
jgi:hypothetical protein